MGPRDAQLHRTLAAGGIIGPLQFAVVSTLLGAHRTGYSPVDQAISDLGIGANAWALNTSLVVLGLLLIGTAIGFYRTVRPETRTALRVATVVPHSLVGLGFGAAGVFPETNPLHWLVGASLIYVGAPLSFLLAGFLLAGGGTRWRPWGFYSLIAGLVAIALIALTFYVFSSYTWSAEPAAAVGHLGGLMERVAFTAILGWYVAFGWRLLRFETRAAEPRARMTPRRQAEPTSIRSL
jgi:hypothetical membrane protein